MKISNRLRMRLHITAICTTRAFSKLLKSFLSLKIKTKLLVTYISVILTITIAIGSITLYTSTRIIENNTEELSGQLVKQVAENIEYNAKDLSNLIYNVIRNEDIKDILMEREEAIDEFNYPVKQRKVSQTVGEMLGANRYINSVCIKSQKEKLFWWENDSAGLSRKRLDRQTVENTLATISGDLDKADNGMLWVASGTEGNQVFFARNMIDEKNLTNKLGIIVFSIDSSFFKVLESDQSMIKERNIVIFDKFNDTLVINNILNDEELRQLAEDKRFFNSPGDSQKVKFGGEWYIATKVEKDGLRFKVFCFIPAAEVAKNSKFLKSLILFICLGAIIFAVFIVYILSSNITKNISFLEKSMRRVETGDFNIRIKPASYDEIGLLGLRFNYMSNKINELVNTVYKERLAKQQAEFQVLQSQINPHFLYNTLGSIKWLARMKSQEDIEKMVTSLIELLKTSISNKSEYQTVEEEINYVKSYLLLQRIRYEDRFRDEYQVDASVRNCRILKFILQPLVENALYHGIEMSKNNGVITIRAFEEGRGIKLEVEDNGVGMTRDKVEEILSDGYKKIYPGLNSIGVKNVNERIRLYFGVQYGLNFTSSVGDGTKVEVTLPYLDDASEGMENDKDHGC